MSAILADALTPTAPPPVTRRRRARRSGTTLRRIDAATMLTPCLVVMLGLLTLPLVQTAIWSFQRASYSGSSGWVGLDNYRRAIEDPDFRSAVGFTLCFAVAQTMVIVAVGYVLAALLNRVRRMRSLYLGILLVPFVVPSVIASTAFGWLFDDNFGGVANQILDHLIGRTFDWFSGTWPNRFLILADVVWISAPFAMIVFLAAMKGVPSELVEAAELDGANWWQRHRYVVYPGIRPMIVFVTMISTMDGLRLFDPLIPLSRAAAANGNLSVELYVYQHAFARANQDVGLGSAINVMMVLLMIPLVLPMVRATRRAS